MDWVVVPGTNVSIPLDGDSVKSLLAPSVAELLAASTLKATVTVSPETSGPPDVLDNSTATLPSALSAPSLLDWANCTFGAVSSSVIVNSRSRLGVGWTSVSWLSFALCGFSRVRTISSVSTSSTASWLMSSFSSAVSEPELLPSSKFNRPRVGERRSWNSSPPLPLSSTILKSTVGSDRSVPGVASVFFSSTTNSTLVYGALVAGLVPLPSWSSVTVKVSGELVLSSSLLFPSSPSTNVRSRTSSSSLME